MTEIYLVMLLEHWHSFCLYGRETLWSVKEIEAVGATQAAKIWANEQAAWLVAQDRTVTLVVIGASGCPLFRSAKLQWGAVVKFIDAEDADTRWPNEPGAANAK